jgi:hypothetical protein
MLVAGKLHNTYATELRQRILLSPHSRATPARAEDRMDQPHALRGASHNTSPLNMPPNNRPFVQVWLVQAVHSEITVDLGVDYGYSTFSFALPQVGKV